MAYNKETMKKKTTQLTKRTYRIGVKQDKIVKKQAKLQKTSESGVIRNLINKL